MFVTTSTIATLLKRDDVDFVTSPRFEKGQEGTFVILKESVETFSGKLKFLGKLPGEVHLAGKTIPEGQWIIIEESKATKLLITIQVYGSLGLM